MSKSKNRCVELEILGAAFLIILGSFAFITLFVLISYLWSSFWDWSDAAWRKLNEETRIEIVNNIPKQNCLESDVVYHVYRGPNSSNVDDVDDVVLRPDGRRAR